MLDKIEGAEKKLESILDASFYISTATENFTTYSHKQNTNPSPIVWYLKKYFGDDRWDYTCANCEVDISNYNYLIQINPVSAHNYLCVICATQPKNLLRLTMGK